MGYSLARFRMLCVDLLDLLVVICLNSCPMTTCEEVAKEIRVFVSSFLSLHFVSHFCRSRFSTISCNCSTRSHPPPPFLEFFLSFHLHSSSKCPRPLPPQLVTSKQYSAQQKRRNQDVWRSGIRLVAPS